METEDERDKMLSIERKYVLDERTIARKGDE